MPDDSPAIGGPNDPPDPKRPFKLYEVNTEGAVPLEHYEVSDTIDAKPTQSLPVLISITKKGYPGFHVLIPEATWLNVSEAEREARIRKHFLEYQAELKQFEEAFNA